MPLYFRIPLPGPFGYSKRIGGRKRRGPTAAQKRAAATAQEQRARQREFNRTHTETVEYLRTVQGEDSEIAVFGRESLTDRELYLRLRGGPVPVPEGTWVTVTYRSGNLLKGVPTGVPDSVAARRAARADHDARSYRGKIINCKIDGVTGGSFGMEADGRDNLHINVQEDTALRFLSLKNGDIVQVTLAKENAGIEEFWHLSRANGSKPRSPANFGPGELSSRRVNDGDDPLPDQPSGTTRALGVLGSAVLGAPVSFGDKPGGVEQAVTERRVQKAKLPGHRETRADRKLHRESGGFL